MSALKQAYQRYTLQEYLALEARADYKSEYHGGYICVRPFVFCPMPSVKLPCCLRGYASLNPKG